MNLFQQTRKLLLNFSLLLLIATATTFIAPQNSWAVTSSKQLVNQAYSPIVAMSVEGRAKAATKNIEGKAQEAGGNVTGDPQDQAAGKAKQVESQARNAVEDAKDNMSLQGRAKAVTKNIEGKFQELVGDITDDPKTKAAGKAKQAESQARNAAEDVKDSVRDAVD